MLRRLTWWSVWAETWGWVDCKIRRTTMRPLSDCRADFPSLSRTVDDRPLAFLDGPAGSQVPQAVIDAVSGYYLRSNANSGGHFPTSRETDEVLARGRDTVAELLGAESGRTISFGASMTTLTFSLAHAVGRSWRPGDEVVITALDHEGNRGPWLRLEERGIVVREAALLADGRVDYDSLERAIGERTRLVAIGAASNLLGTVNDIARARELSAAAGALLAVDAVHYAPHFSIDVQALDVDFLACSAYKFYGPHVGLLYSRPGLLDELDPDRLRTQDQRAPDRIETGTLNHAAIAGVTAAIAYIASWGEGAGLRERLVSALEEIGRHERGVAGRLYERFDQIPGVTIWGPDFSDHERAPTVSATIDGWRPEEAAARLGDSGLQVWDGHFYAIRAVESLGLAEAGGLLRTGILMYNTIDEVERLAEGVEALARGERARSDAAAGAASRDG